MASTKQKYIVDPFLRRVQETVRERDLIAEGQSVLIAVSGGADSMALTHALARISDEEKWRLTVCYVHHGVRGDAADEEVEFVERTACSLGLPFVFKRLSSELKKQARKEGSLESVMREARYKALSQAAKEYETDVIATGHHKDDLTETILWQILRGSGIDGLKGFLPRAAIFGAFVVRPLFDLTREEIHCWLDDQGITWREDESNADLAFTRNRMRTETIPILKRDYQPALADVLHRMAELVAADIDYLESESERISRSVVKECGRAIICIWRDEILKQALSMQRRILRNVIKDVMQSINPPESSQVFDLEDLLRNGRAGSVYRGSNGLTAYIDYNRIFVMKCKSERHTSVKLSYKNVSNRLQQSGFLWSLAPLLCPRNSLRLEISRRIIEERRDIHLKWNDRIWRFQWTGGGLMKQVASKDSAADVRLAVHDLPDVLSLRFRENGDRLWKAKGKAGKKIKDIFIDKKVSLLARDHVPLLASEKSVLWIPGIWGPQPKTCDDKNKNDLLIVSVSSLK